MPGGCNHNRLQTEQLQAGWAKVYVYRGRPFALVDSSGGPLMGYRFVVGVAGVPALLVDDHRAQLVGHAAPAHHAVRERDDEALEHGMLAPERSRDARRGFASVPVRPVLRTTARTLRRRRRARARAGPRPRRSSSRPPRTTARPRRLAAVTAAAFAPWRSG
jgi:hypothetical protein